MQHIQNFLRHTSKGDLASVEGPLELSQPFIVDRELLCLNVDIDKYIDSGIMAPQEFFDAPFQVMYVEVSDGGNVLESTVGLPNGEAATIETKAVLIVEFTPRQYSILCLNYLPGIKRYMPVISLPYVTANQLMSKLIKVINKGNPGYFSSNERIKFKSGAALHNYRRLNKVIYVGKSGGQQPRRYIDGNRVEYSHRFLVRGHWRKHEGVGKNRAGERVVEGMTWVSECEKGDKNLPLIKKVRVVC